jgi:hypothetical protein
MDSLFLIMIGYCLAVIFPVPWLSRAILDAWSRVLKTVVAAKDRYK